MTGNVAVAWHIFQDSGNTVTGFIDRDRFTNKAAISSYVLCAKEFISKPARKYHFIWLLQQLCIARQFFKIKSGEEIFVGIGHIVVLEYLSPTLLVFDHDQCFIVNIDLRNRFQLRELIAQGTGYRERRRTTKLQFFAIAVIKYNALDPVGFRMKIVKGFFVLNEYVDENATGNTECEPGNVDKRINLTTGKASVSRH